MQAEGFAHVSPAFLIGGESNRVRRQRFGRTQPNMMPRSEGESLDRALFFIRGICNLGHMAALFGDANLVFVPGKERSSQSGTEQQRGKWHMFIHKWKERESG
jgi:hypothetical protein